MIKLKQVSTVYGETTLVFEADGFQEGTRRISIPLSDVLERLKVVKQVLGRPITLQDAKDVIKKIVNDMRTAKTPLTERFDFTPYIEVDLEAES